MPPIRYSVFNYYANILLTIPLLGKIMPSYSYYAKKKLVYIIIIALSSC